MRGRCNFCNSKTNLVSALMPICFVCSIEAKREQREKKYLEIDRKSIVNVSEALAKIKDAETNKCYPAKCVHYWNNHVAKMILRRGGKVEFLSQDRWDIIEMPKLEE